MGLKHQVMRILRDSGTFIGHYSIVTGLAADDDKIVTVVNLTNTSLTVAAQPDVPRNVTITIADTTPSITVGTVTVTGKGIRGQTQIETFDCSAGAGTYTGNKPFSKITTVVTSSFATLGGSGDETIKVGIGTKIGLPCNTLISVFKENCDQANDTVGTVSTTYGTIIPNTAMNGSRDHDFWYTYQPVEETY